MSVFYRRMLKSNEFHADAVRQRTELKRNTIDTAARLKRILSRMSLSARSAPSRRLLGEIIEATRLLVDNLNILTKYGFSPLYRVLQNIEREMMGLTEKQIQSGEPPEEPSEVELLVTRDGEVRTLNTRTFRAGGPGGGAVQPVSANPALEGGTAIFPGCSVGPAFIARDCAEAAGAPTGAIVVVENPTDELTGILPYVRGLIAERGDATGGAAVKARELGMPCIFGMEGATRILQSGQQIFLDAFQCKVSALSAPEKAVSADERETAKTDPLFDILFSRNVPATDAKSLRPEKCRSIADILDFAHAGILRYNEISGRVGKMR
ncbi:MAG: PEP-utilizing enzyme [bacterium]